MKAAIKVCVVCGRGNDTRKVIDTVIDGVPVRACDECLADQFRRPRAVEFTLRGRP